MRIFEQMAGAPKERSHLLSLKDQKPCQAVLPASREAESRQEYLAGKRK